MVKINAELDDGERFEITETVDVYSGKPCIEVVQTTPHRIGGAPVVSEIGTFSRREAERIGKALLRSVATSRRKHPPKKGWP